MASQSTFFISMLRYFLLMLSMGQRCFMDGDFGGSDNVSESSSSLSWPLVLGAQSIEIVGPRDFQALSGDLVVWTRLSPLVFNLTGTSDETLSFPSLSMQLLFLQQDGSESFLASESLPLSISTSWEKVNFECNLVVRGGQYNVRLVREGNYGGAGSSGESNDYDYIKNVQILSNITINIRYPTIVFEVPHRIEAYTTSTPITFGLTRSTSCEPKIPLPSTVLVLSICTTSGGRRSELIKTDSNTHEGDTNLMENEDCSRDFATVFVDPLHSLQKEGRITMSVECHLWKGLKGNATYRVQLREKSTKIVIAKSRPIRVEWGSQFSINMSKPTVMPCRGSIRAIVSYPSCILPGKDKIRIYGHETLSVPSLLVPSRLSYIGELQIRPNNRVVTFRCNLFPQRFLRFCFQYINTAVDDSVAVVVEKCIPTNPPLKLSDGGWGAWSSWTPCTITCGSEGKQFRYRFCDNPPPSSGANFCQGEAIEERSCDNTMPECPQRTSILYVDSTSNSESSSSESLNSPHESLSSSENHHLLPATNQKHSFHQLLLLNITTTSECECGCILYDLVPGRNETLVIFISSNHSSPCADEDEVDHHKFKWILQAKDEKDRIRLEVVEMDVQCVTITFRDGNTTDSNLLQVITSQEQQQQEQTHYDELLSQSSQLQGDKKQEENVYEGLTLESTGASLSIASASDSNRNCSGQFIYFIAYYSTLTSTNSSQALLESTGTTVVSWISYEFWTFLVLKLILLFFIVVVVISGFGGCLTKAYRKEKYKELKCFDNEDEEGCSDGTSNPGGDDDTSRCTSVTLMSFDYTYWRRLRILRLKYFLLRPRPLNYISAKIKSFPSTPTHHHRIMTKRNPEKSVGPHHQNQQQQHQQATSSSSRGKATRSNEYETLTTSFSRGEPKGNKSKYKLSKSISLSETNLRVKESVKKCEEHHHVCGKKHKRGGGDEWPAVQRKEDENGGADGAKSKMTNAIYCGDPLGRRTPPSDGGSTSVSNSLNGSEPTSFSMSTPTNPNSITENWARQNDKLLKEKENLKRRASTTEKDREKSLCERKQEQQDRRKYTKRKISTNLTNKKEFENKSNNKDKGCTTKGEMMTALQKRDIAKSQLSVATTQISSSCGEDESRGASRAELEETDQDFEMDYYDYDVMNVGTIPGSYLGLEPAFVLWNSEVYQPEEDYPHHHHHHHHGGGDCEEEEEEEDNLIIPSSSNASNNTSSHEEDNCEFDIEMTTTSTSASTSLGIFSDPHFSKRQITVKETSLDTLKFADEEDSDDNATQASDSIFDNEHDLINDSLTSCS